MSAQPTTTAPDTVTVEIDGQSLVVPKGSMIIQAADRAGIPIPRFCYHDKLSIAANCRMCLIDVEKAPKPMPACATPVMEGMKVYTQSKRALDAQRNVMEFLLINHPLDCPVCDQGGECELQDLSMGYGRSVSRFAERKRVVPDEDLGPLVATEMTRCIQCTRCVRFMGEIAGTHELGGMDRGEDLQIGTWIGKTLESELSGNVIDVCPVGALTNKVYRFRARPWELIARKSIGYHDALGSNLHLHLRSGKVMRAVPRDNEAINECWLSDRDRWAHQGLESAERLGAPMLREGDGWREASWDEALAFAAESLKAQAGDELGILVHPATSNEEGALLSAIAVSLECGNLDHRLRHRDVSDGNAAPARFEMPVAEVGNADVIVLVGCDARREMPLLAHRIRQASRRGARVFAINPVEFEATWPLEGGVTVPPSGMVDALLSLARTTCAESGETPPSGMADALAGAQRTETGDLIASALKQADRAVIVLGDVAQQHGESAWLRALARFVARCCGARLNAFPAGANGVGLTAHGVLPTGLGAAAMMQRPRRGYLLYGCEPPFDVADGARGLRALTAAGRVVALSAFRSAALEAVADVMLPIGLLPEIDATLTNCDGIEQRLPAAARLPQQARPGWRVLRALGERLGVDGFDFTELAQWRARMRTLEPADAAGDVGIGTRVRHDEDGGLECVATVPIYRSDAVLRRCPALNAHPLTAGARVALHPEQASACGLAHGEMASVSGEEGKAVLPVVVDAAVPMGAAWIESCHEATAPLPGTGARLGVTKA